PLSHPRGLHPLVRPQIHLLYRCPADHDVRRGAGPHRIPGRRAAGGPGVGPPGGRRTDPGGRSGGVRDCGGLPEPAPCSHRRCVYHSEAGQDPWDGTPHRRLFRSRAIGGGRRRRDHHGWLGPGSDRRPLRRRGEDSGRVRRARPRGVCRRDASHRQGTRPVTIPSLHPEKRSLANWLRGRSDDAAGLEQRLKDLDTFSRSLSRRWVMVSGVFFVGILGWLSGTIHTSPGTIVLAAGGGAILNALVGLVNERGWYRWWLIYVLTLLDVLLAALPVVWFGHGGLIAGFFIAVLPYTFDQGRTVGDFLVLVASLAYLASTMLHGSLYESSADIPPAAYLETVVFVAVAMALKRIPATLITRIRATRSIMGSAEQGQLGVRAAAAESDELGFLEKSLNR